MCLLLKIICTNTRTSCHILYFYRWTFFDISVLLSPDMQRVTSVFPKARHGNPYAGSAAVRLSLLAAERGNSSLHRGERIRCCVRFPHSPTSVDVGVPHRLRASLFITRCRHFRLRANPFFPIIAMRRLTWSAIPFCA